MSIIVVIGIVLVLAQAVASFLLAREMRRLERNVRRRYGEEAA